MFVESAIYEILNSHFSLKIEAGQSRMRTKRLLGSWRKLTTSWPRCQNCSGTTSRGCPRTWRRGRCTRFRGILKWANQGLVYRLFSVFWNKHHYKFYNKKMWKNVHPVYYARIRSHGLWNISLLPQPLDQSSRPFETHFILKLIVPSWHNSYLNGG